MKATITIDDRDFKVDLDDPIDISIPLRAGEENVNAWYVKPMTIEPVRANGFLGSVAEGGSVNFRNIYFNPHGNGTHTECVGHIGQEVYSLNEHLKRFFFHALVVTIEPTKLAEETTYGGQVNDEVITKTQLESAVGNYNVEALVLRTLPNPIDKQSKQYSNSNPPYITPEAALWLRERDIKHLLIDLPSVDRELDDGRLQAHHIFWNYPDAPRFDCTISEMIYVPDEVEDGEYILNLQIASFENDASPSKPILYKPNFSK